MKRRILVGTTISIGALLPSTTVHADILGPHTSQWGSLPGTWQLSNTTYSNQAGFWQTILCSNTFNNGPVDGWFGPQTEANTKQFQKDVLGYTTAAADGIVDAQTWNDTYWAVTPGQHSTRRLQRGADGYGSYYAGGTATGLYHNGNTDGTWKFYHGASSSWIWATNPDSTSSSACTASP